MEPGIRGRGSPENPGNRFEEIHLENFEDGDPEEPNCPKTVFLRDRSRTILSKNQSPDVGFEFSINPYRGCEHGCIYCYARPTHEYLGFSAGLDFESKILVKEDAPLLLREALSSPRWKPQTIMMSGVTDCYQPVERNLKLTRRCLEVLAEFQNPVCLITKNALVTRDIDLLSSLAKVGAATVYLSVTTLDPDLASVMEPRTSRPAARLKAIKELSDAGIPVGVNVAPIVPGLTDHEIPAILSAARRMGATQAGYILLRLPYGVKDLFQTWLERHFPNKKNKVLNRLKSLRGGKLNETQFRSRMVGEGPFASQIRNLFRVSAQKEGFLTKREPLSSDHFIRPPQPGEQLLLL